MRNKAQFELMLVFIIAGIIFLLFTSNNPANQADNKKTVIILMDGLRWDFVLDNLDELPNFKYIVGNGVYGKLRPASPTFSVASIAGFYSAKKSNNLDWYYAFIFNTSQEWNCSSAFIGELPGATADTDIFDILSADGKKIVKINLPIPIDALNKEEIQYALANNEIIYIYDQNPDYIGHETNLTNEKNILPLMKKLDSKLGLVLEELRNMETLDKTNIIIFGDHGQGSIKKYPKWRLILEDLANLGISEENTCYWNDGGVSVRFWFKNDSVREELEPKIISYFENDVRDKECFFVPDQEYLLNHSLIHADPIKKRTSIGDFIVAVNVGCKLVYEDVVPPHLSGFEEKLRKVDAYLSMHGYLDNEHEEMQAFVGMSGALFKKNLYYDKMEIIDIAPTLLCGMGYKNEIYYKKIDGKIRCDVLKECKC